MSGYLARVVQRHFAAEAGAVVPRRPGWFEPVLPSVQSRWPGETESARGTEAPGRGAAYEAPAVHAEPRAVSRDLPTAPATIAVGDIPRTTASVLDQPPPEILRGPAHATGPRVLRAPSDVAKGVEADSPAATALPPRHERRQEPVGRRPESSVGHLTQDERRSAVAPQAAAAEPRFQPVTRPPRAPAPPDARDDATHAPPVWERRPPVAAGTLPAPAPEGRRAPPRMSPVEATPPDAPDTVEVTIGRIEVRATLAGDAGAKPRTPRTTMTLEEYLRRRASGAAR